MGGDFGFDANFDSDFGGFDNDFAALSTASLPPLNSIPNMASTEMSEGFNGGFGTHAPPPGAASGAPVFVSSEGGFGVGGTGVKTGAVFACCCLMYIILLLLV